MKKVKKVSSQKSKRTGKIKSISYKNLLNIRYRKHRQIWERFCKKNNLIEESIDLDGFSLRIGFDTRKRIIYM